jgi:rfaE bifunctional protein nucleotidyltransferase chain/domain
MYSSASKILLLPDLLRRVAMWRLLSGRVVFTNGCFDLLHLGHVDYLERARHLGDHLIVGLNSDASVRRLKGETRPLQAEYDRARILAALEFVDAVVLFEEDTPLGLITATLPDVLVKGGDYRPEQVVGAAEVVAHGGRLELLSFVDGRSTTSLANKMKDQS